MKRNALLFCGILAPIVYIVAVVLGGAIRPGYNHLTEPVSELTAAGAPNKGLLDIIFLLYNALVVTFAIGLFRKVVSGSHSKLSGVIAAVALIIAGMAGVLLQLFFPQDPGGARAAVTTTGTLHIVFAGIAALASMLATLFAAFWFRRQPEFKGYTVYSLITLAVMFVSGGFGAAAATSGFTLFGLVERITIGALIQWLFFVALKLSTPFASESVQPSAAYRRLSGD